MLKKFMSEVAQSVIAAAKGVNWSVVASIAMPVLFGVATAIVGSSDVWAAATTGVAAPSNAGFGQVMYTAGVTGILQGPIGRVIGTAITAGACYLLYKQEVMGGILAGLGGLGIMNADSIVNSMTAII